MAKGMREQGNTYIFAPIADELFERASQLVHIKVRGFVLPLILSVRFSRIQCFPIVRVTMRARLITT